MAVDLHSRIMRNGDLMFIPLVEGIAMMDADIGRYYALNEVAAAIWELMASPVSGDTICAALLERYEVTPERCAEEVLAILRTFEARGMLRVDA